jgi:hypothetical protein
MPSPKLRVHRYRLLGYCVEGLSWTEMQDRLRVQGTEVAQSTILRFCGRQGFTRLHSQSHEYSPDLKRRWLAGRLGLADLNDK